jgi:hypothetical protein
MTNLSTAELIETVSLIVAADAEPLSVDQIKRRLERLGYQGASREQINQALEDGPFRPVGNLWGLKD